MHLLDTDALTHLHAGRESVQHRLQTLDDPEIDITIFTKSSGSGKSTLLRHFELDNAKAVIDQPEESLADAPLTLFASLNDFRGDPLPKPLDWLNERWQEFVNHPGRRRPAGTGTGFRAR